MGPGHAGAATATPVQPNIMMLTAKLTAARNRRERRIADIHGKTAQAIDTPRVGRMTADIQAAGFDPPGSQQDPKQNPERAVEADRRESSGTARAAVGPQDRGMRLRSFRFIKSRIRGGPHHPNG